MRLLLALALTLAALPAAADSKHGAGHGHSDMGKPLQADTYAEHHALMHGGRGQVAGLTVDSAWVRGTPPGAGVAAAYMRITNGTEAPQRLTGGASPISGRVEVHEMVMADGMMRMAEIEGGLEIAPGETAILQPGGNHLMLVDLNESATPGGEVAVTLEFGDAGSVDIMMPVSAIAAQTLANGKGPEPGHHQ